MHSTLVLPCAACDLSGGFQVKKHVELFAGLIYRLDCLDQSSTLQVFEDLCDLGLLQVGFVSHVFGPHTFNILAIWRNGPAVTDLQRDITMAY